MAWNSVKPLKCERLGIRVTEETALRIRFLAKNMKISRTRLIEKLVDDAYENGWYNALECIEKLPPFYVRPVVRGHWVAIDDYPNEEFECDVCGYVSESSYGPGGVVGNRHNFCPNCGADMKGPNYPD